MVDRVRHIHATRRRLLRESGREPSVEDVAAALRLPATRVEAALKAAADTLSLNAPAGADSDPVEFGDLIEDRQLTPFEQAAARARVRDLKVALAMLDERERRVVELHFGLQEREPMTLEQVGEVDRAHAGARAANREGGAGEDEQSGLGLLRARRRGELRLCAR